MEEKLSSFNADTTKSSPKSKGVGALLTCGVNDG